MTEPTTTANGATTMTPLAPPSRERRSLTEREMYVLRQVACGKTNKEIALELSVNPVTVTNTLRRIYEQLDVQNRTGAIVRAFETGLFPVPEQPAESILASA